jgi:hypothetical protein
MVTTKQAEAGARRVADRARTAGRAAKKRFVTAADAALVKAGHAAERRQRGRALKSAMKVAGKVAIVAGATAASVMAGRAAVRAVGHRREKKA